MNIKYGLALLISAASNAATLTAHTPAVAAGPVAQSEACTGQPVLGREYLGSGKPIPGTPAVRATLSNLAGAVT